MKKFIPIQILVVLFFASCDKDPLPESQSGDFAFVSSVNFNGTNFEFIAGENGIVLQPEFFLFDDSIQFNSAFLNPMCEACGPELRIIIHSPDTLILPEVSNWIEEIQNWEYELQANETQVASLLNLEMGCGNNFSQGVWSLNGEVLNQGMPSNSVSFSVEEGAYTVGFENEDPTCIDGGDFAFDFDSENIPCYGSILFNPSFLNVFNAVAGPGFNPATTTYTWLVDGEEIITEQDSSLFLAVAPSADSICVSINDPSGCFVNVCAALPPPAFDCVTNLFIADSFISDSTISEATSDAFVEIQFIDSEGTFYTSRNSNQNSSEIQLLSASSYLEPNSGNTPFANTSFEVNCNLFDASGNAFPFSGLINTAIALPE